MHPNLIVRQFTLLKVKLWFISYLTINQNWFFVFGEKTICTREAFKLFVLPLPRA
jgi:hypothetical protein